MRPFTILLLILSGLTARPQFFDDFSDGDFTANPTWQGESAKFMVNATKQLQLNDPVGTDVAHLSVPVLMADSTTWEFYFKLNFAPSANNRMRIYLQSDNPDLEGNLHGYYIQVGVSGSSDGFDLYRQSGTSSTLLAAGIAGHGASNPQARMRIVRDAQGHWTVYSDLNGGTLWQLEATATDNTYPSGQYFGFYCKHTTSNASAFFFDDILIDPVQVDTSGPVILNLSVTDSTALDIRFSEPLDQASAGTTPNYQALIAGPPAQAQPDGSDPALVHLTWANPFTNGQQDTLSVAGVKDLQGNTMQAAAIPFVYYKPVPGDMVINEIMADPNPPVGLPEAEYVELYNLSGLPIDLQGWTFSDASSTVPLPPVQLPPGGLGIVCDQADTALFKSFGTLIPVVGLPALNNSGDDLTLTGPWGTTIYQVHYTDGWYRDAGKSFGGWSLELIDPQSQCSGASNWIASENPAGGTPGFPNSVLGKYPDTTGPYLLYADLLNDSTLKVFFSEAVITAEATDTVHYTITPDLGKPLQAIPQGNGQDQYHLRLPKAVQQGSLYTLHASGIHDCPGNELAFPDTLAFIKPFPVDSGDLVINEVLFNPVSGGVDYVEVVNLSQNILDLRGLQWIEENPVFHTADDEVTLSGKPILLKPGEYLAFTSDRQQTLYDYYTPNPGGVIEVPGLPNWPDDDGVVKLQKDSLHVLDRLHYSESWHFPLIDDVNGVSLERINPNAPTQDKNNWHSAASTAGYGTPAYRNSQMSLFAPSAERFTIEPETFSPDQDGYNDYLTVHYNLQDPGFTATVRVFDVNGRPVKVLLDNKLLATEGFLTWDGTGEDLQPLPQGIYILAFELVHPGNPGQVERFRKKCVITRLAR